MSRGIIYQMTGTKLAAHTVVSIISLRVYYDGLITILCDKAGEPLAKMIADDPGLHVDYATVHEMDETSKRKYPHELKKLESMLLSPYQRSIFVDSDTLFCDDPSFLFDEPKLCMASPLNLRSTSRHWYAQRIVHQLKKASKCSAFEYARYQDVLRANRPFVNTGLVAFNQRDWHLAEALAVSVLSKYRWMYDELAVQMCLPEWVGVADIELISPDWNTLPRITNELAHAKMIHLNWSSWYTIRHGRALFLAALRTAVDMDVAGMRTWAAESNPLVKKLLEYGMEAHGMIQWSPDHE